MKGNLPLGSASSLAADAGGRASISCKIEETLIPAAPGTYLLHYGRLEGELWVAREVIIAWQVNDTLPEPITRHGVFRSETCASIVLHPDGRVHEIDALFETYEDWLADVELNFPAT